MIYCPVSTRVPDAFAACLLMRLKPWVGCLSERTAAELLGYTQASWDNESGNEQPPATADKAWAELTGTQKAAAAVL